MHGKGRKSRETVGHYLRPVFGLFENARHADGGRVRRQGDWFTYRELGQSCFAEPVIGRRFAPTRWPRFRNNRFVFTSRQLTLVFRGAVGRRGLAAADARP